jgi:hypothetical protein
MATRAASIIGRNGAAKAVDDLLFAQLLAGVRVGKFPIPMECLVDLLAGLCMTAQAGFGHFGSRFEILLQHFEFTMVRCRAAWLFGGGGSSGLSQTNGEEAA